MCAFSYYNQNHACLQTPKKSLKAPCTVSYYNLNHVKPDFPFFYYNQNHVNKF